MAGMSSCIKRTMLTTIIIGIDNRASVNSATTQHRQSQPVPHMSDRGPGMSCHIQWPIVICITVGNNGTAVQQQTHTSDRPDPSQPCLPVQPEDIVTGHRQRNHVPRLPSNTELLATRQRQTLSTNQVAGEALHNGDGQEPPIPSKTSQETTTASKSSRPVRPTLERAEPSQLQFCDPPTHNIIECAKQFSHCDTASINAFPVRATFNVGAIEYINEAIAKCQSRGLIISDGKLALIPIPVPSVG